MFIVYENISKDLKKGAFRASFEKIGINQNCLQTYLIFSKSPRQAEWVAGRPAMRQDVGTLKECQDFLTY